MQTVNEGSTAYLTITFKDKTGTPQVPSSITYRIDCMTSGLQVLADTPVTPASSVEITLTPSQNAMLVSGNVRETKRVTVKTLYGISDALNDQYDYQVINLPYVS